MDIVVCTLIVGIVGLVIGAVKLADLLYAEHEHGPVRKKV